MVSLSTLRGGGLTAAVRDQSFLRFWGHDVHTVRPVKGVVAPAALELKDKGEGVMGLIRISVQSGLVWGGSALFLFLHYFVHSSDFP